MAVQKLQVAVAGLGRMGKRHAVNFLHRTPRATVVAAFTPDETEQAWAKANLEPHGVTIYSDYNQMINQEGLQAVVIATATKVHAEEALAAIEKDLHVLCEKPISLSIDTCREVIQAAKAKPHLKVMCGFSRRFDSSYRDAYEKAEAGIIGRPPLSGLRPVISTTLVVSSSIHDIDLTLWFFGEDTPVKSVAAAGVVAVAPGLKQYEDFDNAVGIVEFYGGRVAYYYCSRMMAHGQEDTTEFIGTEGKLTVNGNPQANLVNTYTNRGITREVPAHYYGRFEYAFVAEANEFTAAALDNTKLPFNLTSALRAVEIGSYLQEALRSQKKLYFDEIGNRIEQASL
ncbi:hypothetical protein EKO27_g11116 [Xylaria grammica]|uniref:Gfo/Idh/MocA-like oxidoreductase N-terminal domain-containing protein n=1 Tax=Xylaria grammica TaxID=363999 RepID=A0A439CPA9_9PEZI|nr:hypothetical protein EKO27_g11116 [Xylaria grammica]